MVTFKRIFCVAIFIIPCFIVGIMGYAIHGLSSLSGCKESNPEQIEYLAHFKMPPSAHKLKSSCFGLQAYGADASFEMNPADLEMFIASTAIEPSLFTEKSQDIQVLNDRLKKKASGMESYLYGKYISVDFTQEILIDISSSERYIVYIFAGGG